jgi:hypothetical protein
MPEIPTLRDFLRGWLPTVPQCDLSVQPWIDVCAPDGREPRRISLREVLSDAHELRLDGAERGPLWVHATHRFLIALTYQLHAHDPDHPWEAVGAGQAPLPAVAIDRVLARLANRLWLHHPDTPFLQNLAVLEHMDAKAHKDPQVALELSTDPFWSLLPEVPSKSNTAWFGRAHDTDAPDEADAAAALLMRHYFALPGNEAPNRQAGTKTSKGGATGLTHNGRSFVTITGPNLASTLTRNLLTEWLDVITPDTPTFLDEPDALAANISPINPLWTYTASAAATVLVPTPHHPDRYRVVRTPVGYSKDTAAKTLAGTMARNDPHALRVDPKTAGQPHSHVKLTTAGSDLDLVRRFCRDIVDQSALHSPTLLGRRALAYGHAGRDVDVLVIDGAGSSMGPRIAATAMLRPPAGTLTIVPERASRYLELANQVSGTSGAASHRIARRIHLVLSPDASAPRPAWLYPTCDEQLAGAAEDVLRELLKVCAEPGQPLPAGLEPSQRAAVTAAALSVFDRLVAPHGHRPAKVPQVVRQRQALANDLNRLWSAR